jgi:hypothetical protein
MKIHQCKKIYIRFTYFMFYLVKVSPIARVTSYTNSDYPFGIFKLLL